MAKRKDLWPVNKKDKAQTDGEAVSKSPKNAFQNDGSFMEMFKKLQGQSSTDTTSTQQPAKKEEAELDEAKQDVEPPCYTTQTICYKDGVESDAKPQYQGIIGKRKTLLKTVELREKRKKRREEIEEQQSAELKEQKSSAWKSYMAEVKAYEDRRCGDTDDHKRPLVK